MDVASILAELRKDREQIDHAIASLERLAGTRKAGDASAVMGAVPKRGRGRPPGSKNKFRRIDGNGDSAKVGSVDRGTGTTSDA